MNDHATSVFNLTEEEAIAILQTPLDQLEDTSERYLAASNLAFFSSDASIQTLIATVANMDLQFSDRLTRRKAVESLGKLKASASLPILSKCLDNEDDYLVEKAIIAIGEIGTDNLEILEKMRLLLTQPRSYSRQLIQVLTKLNYQPAIPEIQKLTTSASENIASAAITSLARFSGDYSHMSKIIGFLDQAKVNDRRDCIQDLIDVPYYQGMEAIAKCPLSIVFRLRAIRLMSKSGLSQQKLTFHQIQTPLEMILRDHVQDLNFVYQYDQKPSLEFLINELYDNDFERAYLATKSILELYGKQAPDLLRESYAEKARSNYNAHYHFIKLFGWLKYNPAYDLIIHEALENKFNQFQKSRLAGAIALGELGEPRAIPVLKQALETNLWDVKYACLIALEKLGDPCVQEFDKETIALLNH